MQLVAGVIIGGFLGILCYSMCAINKDQEERWRKIMNEERDDITNKE